jgi:hypothetical protein
VSGTASEKPQAPLRTPRIFRLVPRVILGLLAVALATFAAVERYAPFDPSAPPHLFTGVQFSLMKAIPSRCVAALERAEGVSVTRAPRPIENGCGYPDGVRIRSDEVGYGGAVLLRCPAAVALVMWERHVLQPAAQRHFGRQVTAVQTFGTYACRNVYHRSNARRSQHATANAVDIAGVTLAGGETVSVRRDWRADNAKSAFLRDLRDGACGLFGSTLSPDYNAAHADHFHFDMGGWRACR